MTCIDQALELLSNGQLLPVELRDELGKQVPALVTAFMALEQATADNLIERYAAQDGDFSDDLKQLASVGLLALFKLMGDYKLDRQQAMWLIAAAKRYVKAQRS